MNYYFPFVFLFFSILSFIMSWLCKLVWDNWVLLESFINFILSGFLVKEVHQLFILGFLGIILTFQINKNNHMAIEEENDNCFCFTRYDWITLGFNTCLCVCILVSCYCSWSSSPCSQRGVMLSMFVVIVMPLVSVVVMPYMFVVVTPCFLLHFFVRLIWC